MKISELEGDELSQWVARADGWEPCAAPAHWDPKCTRAMVRLGFYFCMDCQPIDFLSWNVAGPIIEREEIELTRREVMPSLFEWVGTTLHGFEQLGHSPLIAAMRAYVASKFGEELPPSP